MRKTVLASLALSLVFACSNGNGGSDAGSDSPSGNDASNDGSSGNTFAQTGTIVDFSSKAGLPGVTVSGGGATATTDSMGNYTLSVPKNTPYSMTVVGPTTGTAYVTLDEQEWMLTGNANRGQTSFVSAPTEMILIEALNPTPQPTLAVLSVIVEAVGTCASDAGGADVTGATITVPGLAGDGGSGATVVYFSGGFPAAGATSVTAGQLPSALIYNLPVSATFNSIIVSHPTCHAKPFPVTDPAAPTISYTGNVQLQPSQPAGAPIVVSNIRVFLD
jgi:hypothetical protein